MNLGSHSRMNCEQVEVLIGARLDGSLEQADRATMDAHIAGCNDCRAMVSDIERIVADARVLPALTPTRDLWHDIDSRLGAQDVVLKDVDDVQVRSLQDFRASRGGTSHGARSWRMLAAAAVLLIAVTAGVTWNIAHSGSGAATVPQVASTTPAETGDGRGATAPASGSISSATDGSAQLAGEPASSSAPALELPRVAQTTRPRATRPVQDSFEARRQLLATRYVANSAEDVDAIYEREIAALRTIVNERFAELDSTTVIELKKNLDIIDQAIVDSKAALRRDPRSRMLSRQLDRAIEHKMELLRRVALL